MVKSRRVPQFILLASLTLGLTLAGCSTQITRTGQLPDRNAVKAFQIGQTTKKEVSESVGTPSTVSAFSDDVWYYVGQTRRTRAFLKEKIERQTVLAMGFDQNEVLQGTRVYTLANGILIRPNPDVTPTEGRKISLWEELLGNIGRISSIGDR